MRFIISLLLIMPLPLVAQERPNIVFILADDLGCFELGCYGQQKIKTPNIDRLAERGMKFTRFYAGNNVCAPSRCSLLTGKHPGHATIRDNREAQPEGQHPIQENDANIAKLLKKQGYTCGAIGKWGLGMFGTSGDPLRHGFDFFYGYNCQRHAHSHYPKYLYRNSSREELPGNTHQAGPLHSHDLFETETLRWLELHQAEPFFLYLPYTVPHVAVQVPEADLAEYRGKLGDDPAYDGKKGYQPHPAPRAGYAAMVSKLDRTVGRIVAKLDELQLSRKTLIVFTSDNGPTHNVGGADSTFFQSAGKLRGLKGSMYEGGLRVPLIACWPGRIQPGTVNSDSWAFWDVLPTLAELTGAKPPVECDGISFLPTLLGRHDKQKRHDFLYWESPGYGGQQAVISGEWKAVRQQLKQQAAKGTLITQLYHLGQDEAETKDLAGEHPDVLQRLVQLMEREHQPSKLFPLAGVDAK
ncbi:MAG: arylsulfatase [Gemmatales bacterium]